MRAYLIDAIARSIKPVEYGGNIDEIYALTGCDTFDAARFNDKGDAVFIDDEGLLKQPHNFFMIEGYSQPLAGNGLVLGCDEDGESIEPSVNLEWLAANVRFMSLPQVREWAGSH